MEQIVYNILTPHKFFNETSFNILTLDNDQLNAQIF
jgi:hypothetical protein